MLGVAHFYHERIKRSVGAFGTLFNNINIIRKNSADAGTSQVRVPLSYAPKRKFLADLQARQENELNTTQVIAITLPRMSFEIVGINYDPQRQLPKTNNSIVASGAPGTRTRLYTKTPYNIQFQLNIYAKNQDDALQVVEQIFPYFAPQYTLTMMPLDDYPDIKEDIPLVLNSVSFSDDYEGPMEQRRTIIYTLDFEMKINFYGPTSTGKVIQTAFVDFFSSASMDSDTFIEGITVTTNPTPVHPDSDFVYITLVRSPDS